MKIIAILTILAVIVAVIAVVIYLMGQFEQTKPIAAAATDLVTKAADYVKGNIPTIVAAGGTATALGGVALSKIQSAKQQVQQVTDQAKTQIDSFSAEKEALKTQFADAQETAKQQIAQASDLQKAAENKAIELEKANTQLTGKLDGMTDMHNNFVAQLTSGAQTIIDPATNQTYKLITLEKIVVK